jgi:spectrin alpha
VERDLAALEDKVSTLGQEADRLCGIHADHAEQIQAKRAEIESYWQRLRAKAKVKQCLGLNSLNQTWEPHLVNINLYF